MTRTALQIEYAQLAREYDERWKTYTDRSHQALLSACPKLPGGICLDAGCGTGELLRRLSVRCPEMALVGVDASREMLAIAKGKGLARTTFLEGDLTAIPFADQSVDLVVSSSALHFVPQWRDAVAEWSRVLRPGGFLVITDWWNGAGSMRWLDLWMRWVNRAHRPAIPAADLHAEMIRCGLDPEPSIPARAGGLWWVCTTVATRCRIGHVD
jgi:ubiquinone/menaquinone biosynthesis C-methylase UbiE